MTTPNETFIGGLAAKLRDCVCAELVPGVCRCTRVPGITAAWDNCCEGSDCNGQAWVATPRIHPSRTFPEQATNRFKCGVSFLVITFQVGVIRCSQALTQEGHAPSDERLEQESTQALADQCAVMKAIICCFVPNHVGEGLPWNLGEWAPVGPQGGCVGGTTSLQVGVGGCPE